MAAVDTTAPGAGPHTPVSNQPEVDSEVEWELTEPSSPGEDGGGNTTGNEVEDVEGHESMTLMEMAPDAFTVPDEEFPDIGMASFGAEAETVHGVDNRTQIGTTNTFPWRAIASLLITAADNSMW